MDRLPRPKLIPAVPSVRPAHGKLSPRRMYGVRALPSRVPLAVAIETPYHNFWGFRLTEMVSRTNRGTREICWRTEQESGAPIYASV